MSFIQLILFVMGSLGIVWFSRSSLKNSGNHGFYRFFAWEVILVLFVRNMPDWFQNPFSPQQLLSWVFLILSLILIAQGVQLFRQEGNLDQNREDPTLVGIEKTTQLVTSGVYGYIRHPFYASLLFLTWGIFIKQITWIGFILALWASIFLFITAKIEEGENIQFFGNPYQDYMQSTKMFIPFIL